MPYIGKPQSADPITVTTTNIEDGSIIAADISSSLGNVISGSFTTVSSSFSTRVSDVEAGSTSKTLVSSSAQLAADISGSFQGGGSNQISGSSTSTGSFGSLVVPGQSTLGVTSATSLDADGGVTVDNITIDGTEIDLSSGDLTLDVEGDIIFDANGADIKLKDDGTEFGRLSRVSSDLVIKSISNNNDILLKGVDDSATITALTLDMSEAGDATFNRSISASSISTGSIGRLQTHQANALFGSNTLTLGGDLTTAGTFTTQNNNVTVNAVGAARTITLNESLTVGDGNDGTITFSGASKTLTVEENSNVNQDLTTDASPTFAAGTITGDFAVGGTLTAQEVHTEFESASILFTSGSTQFGNSSDDVHDFKGNTISGSVTSTGSFGSIVTKGTGVTTFMGGDVGIGTDSPTGQLTIASSTSPTLTFKDTGGGTDSKIFRLAGGGDAFFFEGRNDADSGDGDAGTMMTFNLTNGNVGIGTDNPAYKLEVADATNPQIAVTDTTNTVTTMLRALDDQGYVGTQTDHPLRLVTDGTIRATLDTSGNVGIGTATPVSGGLHIHTDASTEGIYLKSTGNTRNNLVFDSNISSAADNIAFIDANWNETNVARISMFTGTDTSNKDDGRIGFATAAAGTVAERMRIESDGRVAIKATSFPQDFGNDRGHLLISSVDDAGANNYGVLQLQGHSIANDVAVGSIAFYDHDNNTALIQTQRDDSTSKGNILFYTNGGSGVTERMRIKSTGVITTASGSSQAGGISIKDGQIQYSSLGVHTGGTNTYTPASGNHINSAITIDFPNANDSAGLIRFRSHGSMEAFFGYAQDGSNGQGDFVFQNYNGSAYAELMRITQEGQVGIGTTANVNDALLHVKGNGGGHAIAVFEDDTVNANVLIKASDANRNSILNFGDAGSSEIGQVDYDHNDNSMRFVVNAAETIRIANTGDVGIGDDNPDGRLTVNHGANDTGHITIKNSDVAHSFTSLVANDTFVDMRKYSNAEGGLNLQGFSEGERGLALSNFSTVYDTPSNGTAVDKGFQFFAYALSGTNAGNINSNGTAYIFRVRRGDASPAVVLIDEDGDIHADGSTSITGYDYAEMFEWEDGNTGEEDRVGYSVVFGSSGDKIRVASGSEEPIGVVSARPGVIGDNPLAWQGKWKTDEWDRKIPKLIPMVSWSYDFTRGNGEVVQKTFRTEIAYTGSFLSNIPSGSSERGVPYGGSIPSNAHYYNKEESQLADDYDETRDYTTRRGRGEWDTIGLMGKIKVRTGQATGSRWIKMKDVSDSIQLWLVK